MRDPKRIDALLNLVKEYRTDGRQDQRFFQMVLNLGRQLYQMDHCYGKEDTKTIELLESLPKE